MGRAVEPEGQFGALNGRYWVAARAHRKAELDGWRDSIAGSLQA